MFSLYEENKKSYSFFLFALPRFLTGFASLLDIGATLTHYNEFSTPEEADARAIKSDWAAIGNDLRFVSNQWEKNNYAQ